MGNTKGPGVIKEMTKDEICTKIMDALCDKELSYDELMAIGDDPQHTAAVIELMLATGLLQEFCGSVRPSSCRYKLAD